MDELYQTQILSLARGVRQSTKIAHPTHHARHKNPVCGDEVHISLLIRDQIVDDIHIMVKGCALCEAGAGLLYQQARSQKLADITLLSHNFSAFLQSSSSNAPRDMAETMTGFDAFTPVREVKNRHKCVTLAFGAFAKAVKATAD